MPNILVISGSWPTVSNSITGIFVVEQIMAFCRLNCDITVLVGRTLGKRTTFLTIAELGLPENHVRLIVVPILRFPENLSAKAFTFKINIFSVGMAVRLYLSRHTRRHAGYDACIVHSIRYYALSSPYWARKVDCPKIFVVHGVDPFLTKQHLRKHIKQAIRATMPTFQYAVLVGSTLEKHVCNLQIEKSKSVVVPNGTNVPRLARTESKSVSPVNNCTKKVILSVSNLVELKGIDDNLKALSILRDRFGIKKWEYRIVGDGPEKKRLESLALSLGISEHVVFLGRLPRADTLREFGKCDLFSLPSWGEAFGIVYLEAMARMRPVIGCFFNGAADIITHQKDGLLVPPKNPKALAREMRKLWEDPIIIQQIAQCGRETAEHYSWEINAQRVLKLLGV